MNITDLLRRFIYGKPIVIETAPRLLHLYEDAAPKGEPVIVTTREEYWMVMCDTEFVSYVKDVPRVPRLFDDEGREHLGHFRVVQVKSTYIADGTEGDEAIERIRTALKIKGRRESADYRCERD